jgi:hypothetical protein
LQAGIASPLGSLGSERLFCLYSSPRGFIRTEICLPFDPPNGTTA